MIRKDKPSMTQDERDAVLAFIARPAFRGEVKPAETVRLVRVANGYWTQIRKATTKSSITLTTLRS